MTITLYILYAFVQAILVTRYVMGEKEPVGSVIVCSIFAPVVSVILLLGGFCEAVKWLVTYRPNK